MSTIYVLGEVCKWSRGDNPQYRYVDVYTHRPNREKMHQVLELPEKDAIALEQAMTPTKKG